jgi:PAS domain S-box-containing protein
MLRRQEVALHESEARQRAILAATLDPIVTIDFRGIVHSASDSVERVFGWKPEELVGQNLKILMPEPHRSEHDAYLNRYRKTGQTVILGRTREFSAVRKDGSSFPCEVAVSRLDLPGSSGTLFVGIIRDISERKRAEEELARHREHLEDLVKQRTAELKESHAHLRLAERLASVGTLAAGVAHEINNPLATIASSVELLSEMLGEDDARKGSQGETFRRHMKKIEESVYRCKGIIQNLLAFTRREEQERAYEEVDMFVLLNNTLDLVEGNARKKGIEVVRPDGGEFTRRLRSRPNEIQQVVLNLMLNALDVVEEGGKISVSVREKEAGAEVTVADTGKGIDPSHLDRIFDPFFTTKPVGKGTGLGLYLCHQIVRGLGGRISVESRWGEGATFRVWFPSDAAVSVLAGERTEGRGA